MKTPNWLKVSLLAAMVSTAHAQPITVKDAAQEAVLRNPEVQAKWHAFKEATENVGIARGPSSGSIFFGAAVSLV